MLFAASRLHSALGSSRFSPPAFSFVPSTSTFDIMWRGFSYWSAADFGAINSALQAFARAELGYVSPGSVTNSLGNWSARFHESTFQSAMVFAAASGCARNLSAHTG